MNFLFVVSGTIYEYYDWMENGGKNRYNDRHVIMVTSRSIFNDVQNPDGLLIGTWYERVDIYPLLQKLRKNTTDPIKSKKIDEIFKRYWKIDEIRNIPQ